MRWLVLVILLIPAVAQAHGSVSERIDKLSRELSARPNDARLLVDRGALYALEDRATDAVQDFEDAYELDPKLPGIEHRLANALSKIGESERAIELLSKLLRREPHHFDARVVRARAYVHLGEVDKALADYDIAIDNAERPAPRYYRERAKLLAEQGRIDEALHGLRAGIERIGPVVSLVEPAIDHEIARGHHDRALALADLLAPALRDSPDWRARRAAWLAESGRSEEAHEQYELALDAIAALPTSRRQSEAMSSLEARIRSELAEAAPPPLHSAGPLWFVLALGCGLLVFVRQRFRRA